jgi:hypothetical protein
LWFLALYLFAYPIHLESGEDEWSNAFEIIGSNWFLYVIGIRPIAIWRPSQAGDAANPLQGQRPSWINVDLVRKQPVEASLRGGKKRRVKPAFSHGFR